MSSLPDVVMNGDPQQHYPGMGMPVQSAFCSFFLNFICYVGIGATCPNVFVQVRGQLRGVCFLPLLSRGLHRQIQVTRLVQQGFAS